MNPIRGAVIFDMDGTLIRSNLDFDLMRAEIGIENTPILEALEKMSTDDRRRAEAILHRHEERAAASSELLPGALEVVAAIRAAGWPIALMTRNTRLSVEAFQKKHGFSFDFVRTREDGPYKPSPEPIFDICRALQREPTASYVVGDFHYDVRCGKAAGATAVLLLENRDVRPDWADEADHVILELTELPALLGLNRTGPRQPDSSGLESPA